MQRRIRSLRDAGETVAEVVEVVVDRLERGDDRHVAIGVGVAHERGEDAAALHVVRLAVDLDLNTGRTRQRGRGQLSYPRSAFGAGSIMGATIIELMHAVAAQ